MKMIRIYKAITVLLLAGYFSMVVFNNLFDYQTNLNYMQHTMNMDTLAAREIHGWRSINSPHLHNILFLLVIIMETAVALLCFAGGIKLLDTGNVQKRHLGKELRTCGLTLALVIWFGVFFIIAGEWFLAWQTPWNALPSASRIMTTTGIVLIFINLPETCQTE